MDLYTATVDQTAHIEALRVDVQARSNAIANVFPLMSDAELIEMARSIKQDGLLHPILLDLDGKIADGRNRWIACTLAGVDPTVTPLLESVNVADIIRSENILRRHLSTTQRAAFAADLANLKQGGKQPAGLQDAISDARAAELMGISERSERKAKKVKKIAPALHEKMKSNEVPLETATAIVEIPDEEERHAAVQDVLNGNRESAARKAKRAKLLEASNAAYSKRAREERHSRPPYVALIELLTELPEVLVRHEPASETIAELTALFDAALSLLRGRSHIATDGLE